MKLFDYKRIRYYNIGGYDPIRDVLTRWFTAILPTDGIFVSSTALVASPIVLPVGGVTESLHPILTPLCTPRIHCIHNLYVRVLSSTHSLLFYTLPAAHVPHRHSHSPVSILRCHPHSFFYHSHCPKSISPPLRYRARPTFTDPWEPGACSGRSNITKELLYIFTMSRCFCFCWDIRCMGHLDSCLRK